jgi:hypothetical protein
MHARRTSISTLREKALVDRDTSAGVLLIKVAKRRATLLGLNPPMGHAVSVIQHESLERPSTGRVLAAIDRICGQVKPDEPDDPEALH